MSHIQSYMLVTADTVVNFTLAINRFLSEGWELHGPTQVVHQLIKNERGYEVLDIYHYQAMVLLKPPIPEPQPE